MASRQALHRLLALFLFVLAVSPGCGGGGGGGNNPPPPPMVTTAAAEQIGTDNAVIDGTVNPNAQDTNGWLEWGSDNTLSSFTSTLSKPLGAGTTVQIVSASISGLTAGKKYFYRVAARNASGTIKGSIASFTTALPNSPPGVETNAATFVTITGGVLNGTVSPNELATTAVFEWGTDSNLVTFSSTPSQSPGSGTTSVAITDSLSGLTPGLTYFFRVAATNSAGTSKGTIASFTTIALPPAVSTAAATSVTLTGGTLNGSVNPNGLAVNDVHFEYGTDSNLATFASTSVQALAAGFTAQGITASLPGLVPGTTYYFRVAATNSAGMSKGAIVGFTTIAQPPAVSTAAATSVTLTGGTLNGSVNPNGLAVTDAHFEYGTDSNLATFASTGVQALAAGFTAQGITASLPGLVPGTTYYFRVAATNSAGTSKGAIVGFTTIAQPPVVSTDAATSVTLTGGTLNGSVNPNGLAVTDAHFEYGTDSNLATFASTSVQALAAGFTAQGVTAPLTGLAPGTTYYFRVAATNSAGTSQGTIVSVTTSSLGTGTFTYNSSGKNARVTTGDSQTVTFSKLLPAVTDYSGVFSLDFSPTSEYGSGGSISIRLLDTPTTYFQLSTKDAMVTKVRKGVVVDSAPFPFPYSQGGTYSIRITFSQTYTTFEAFGGSVSLSTNTSANPIIYFEVESTQQDAFYDNIRLETGTPPVQVYFDDFSTDSTGTYTVY